MFVYEAVLEAIKTGNTTLARKNFRTIYEQMLYGEEACDETGEEDGEMDKGKHLSIDKQYQVSFVLKVCRNVDMTGFCTMT